MLNPDFDMTDEGLERFIDLLRKTDLADEELADRSQPSTAQTHAPVTTQLFHAAPTATDLFNAIYKGEWTNVFNMLRLNASLLGATDPQHNNIVDHALLQENKQALQILKDEFKIRRFCFPNNDTVRNIEKRRHWDFYIYARENGFFDAFEQAYQNIITPVQKMYWYATRGKWDDVFHMLEQDPTLIHQKSVDYPAIDWHLHDFALLQEDWSLLEKLRTLKIVSFHRRAIGALVNQGRYDVIRHLIDNNLLEVNRQYKKGRTLLDGFLDDSYKQFLPYWEQKGLKVDPKPLQDMARYLRMKGGLKKEEIEQRRQFELQGEQDASSTAQKDSKMEVCPTDHIRKSNPNTPSNFG